MAPKHRGIGRPTSRQGDGNEDDPATNFQEDREKCKNEAEVCAVLCSVVGLWIAFNFLAGWTWSKD